MEIDPIQANFEWMTKRSTLAAFPSWFQKAKTTEQTIGIQKSFLTSLSQSTRHGTFFACNSLLRFVLLAWGIQFYGYLFSFFPALDSIFFLAFEIFTLMQRDGSQAPSINPIAFNGVSIFATIWHKRIINNSICLIRNICCCHYLDLSAADIFPLFTGKEGKNTKISPLWWSKWFCCRSISLMFDQK